MKKFFIFLNIISLLGFISCEQENKSEAQTSANIIEISKEEFQNQNMKLGYVEKIKINEKLSFSGKVVPKTNGIAKISVPVPGKVISVNVKNGQTVNSNSELIKIGGGELIDLQQNFASSSAKLNQLKLSYTKAKQLFDENIKSESEYLLIESNYKVELANYGALKSKLQNIGLSLSNIENGKYASSYTIKAPIAGQISEIYVVNGQNVGSDEEIIEISDNTKTELHLSIFEKDYSKIKEGLNLIFWGIDKDEDQYKAIITRKGSKLNSHSNTIDCYAEITDGKNDQVINQMINGEITVATDSILTLPKSAIFPIGSKNYVLINTAEDEVNYQFKKQKIRTGKAFDQYYEILDTTKQKILIKGLNNVEIE